MTGADFFYIITLMTNIEEYTVVSKNGTAVAKALIEIWEKIGKPEDFESSTGKALLKEIARVYEYFFRREYLNFLHDRSLDLTYEKSIDQMGEGYIPLTYPPTLFNLIKAMFPNVNLSSRSTQRIMIECIPYLKSTNLKV